jgi:pimeloyl-ACP methyl ester carboxylesterase
MRFWNTGPTRAARHARLLAPALAAVLAAGCSAPDAGKDVPDARMRLGELRFEPCALHGGSAGIEAVEAQCTTVEVPEDHDAPDGRTIGLAVALVPARGYAQPDPVLMISGGPGQSALESYPALARAFADVRRNRHVLLVDARGTGGSHPLRCPGDEPGESAFGADDPSPAAQRDFAARCAGALGKEADLRRYTTADHVRDLEFVRQRIGAPQLNLMGISYGTRVAQQYAKAEPEHTRTVVLDSVAPNGLALGQEHARNLDAALAAQFARCGTDAGCNAALGDIHAQLARVRAALESGTPGATRYRDATTGEWHSDVPTFGHLALLLRMYAYQPATASLLPWLVHEAAQGDYAPMLAQSRMLAGALGDTISHGMQLSVICTEDAPRYDPVAADEDTGLGAAFLESMIAQCSAWPTAPAPEDMLEPLTGDVPLLAMSGEFDPVTPPRYGEAVVKGLPNARHLVLPGQGHNVIGAGCMPKLFAQFVESADAAALDASCLDRIAPLPPFAGSHGWEP